jgi:hypothetical protein
MSIEYRIYTHNSRSCSAKRRVSTQGTKPSTYQPTNIQTYARKLPSLTVHSVLQKVGTFNGVDHVIVPISSPTSDLVQDSELVPMDSVCSMPAAWNGHAVVIDDGTPYNSSPSQSDRVIGIIFNAYRGAGNILNLQAWIDPSKAPSLDFTTLSATMQGFVIMADGGRTPAGEQYISEWYAYLPDYISVSSSSANSSAPPVLTMKGASKMSESNNPLGLDLRRAPTAWDPKPKVNVTINPVVPCVYSPTPFHATPPAKVATNAAAADAADAPIVLRPVPTAWDNSLTKLHEENEQIVAFRKANSLRH